MTRIDSIKTFAAQLASDSIEASGISRSEWAPADFLPGDLDALEDAFGELSDEEAAAAFAAYRAA